MTFASGRAVSQPQPVPRTPQPVSRTSLLPPGISKVSHTAKTFFFLAASYLKAEKLNLSQEDGQISYVLHHCNMKGVVLRRTCEKVLKAFSPEPCVVWTQKVVVVTRQVTLSILVQAVQRYDLPFPISRKSQTHTRSTSINYIDILCTRDVTSVGTMLVVSEIL